LITSVKSTIFKFGLLFLLAKCLKIHSWTSHILLQLHSFLRKGTKYELCPLGLKTAFIVRGRSPHRDK